MQRRIILKLIAAGFLPNAVPPQGLLSIAAATKSYEPQFFSLEEMKLLDRLTEIIIPEDDHSPGAHAAQVNIYLDVVVSEGSEPVKQQWRKGLGAAEQEAKGRFEKPLSSCDPKQLEQIVALMAENEKNPATALERFFTLLKRATIDGYYTSKVGIHEDLQYQGNTAVAEFPGCTHEQH